MRVGGPPWKRLKSTWQEIAEIRVDGDQAIIRTKRGRQRVLNLAELNHASEIRRALAIAKAELKRTKVI